MRMSRWEEMMKKPDVYEEYIDMHISRINMFIFRMTKIRLLIFSVFSKSSNILAY